MAETLSIQDTSAEKKVPWSRPKTVSSISPDRLGCVSEVMILDSQCGVLVHKRCILYLLVLFPGITSQVPYISARQNITYRKAQQVFAKHMKTIGQTCLSPYFRDEGIDFFYLSKNDIYLVAVHPSPDTDTAISVVIYLDFLQRLYEILKDCIGTVNEPYVAVNRMLVFEILDETLTCGYGLISSYAEIKSHLICEPIRPKILQQDELASRFFGINTTDKSRTQSGSSQIKHKSPDSVYLNIVEGLSAVLGPNGEIFSSELWGKLTLISTLKQPSPIMIQLTPDLVIQTTAVTEGQVAGATHIENPSFHSCVDTSQLAKRKLLRVFPPPDQTRLMIYTLSDSACIHIPIVIVPSLVAIDRSRDQNLSLRLINQAQSHATASYVRVKVQLPQCVFSVSTMKFGDEESQSSRFITADRVAEWEVKRSAGSSEEVITFRLIINSDTSITLADIGPISVAFNMTNFSASGLVVKVARITGHTDKDSTSPSPECYFGVSTKAASYTIRTDSSKEQTS